MHQVSSLSDSSASGTEKHFATQPNQSARPVTPIGVLSDKLDKLSSLHRAGHASEFEFGELLSEATNLASGFEKYVSRCTSPESSQLAALANRTACHDWNASYQSGQTQHPVEREMLSGHVEGQLLQILIRSIRADRVLDVGMFTGYSSLAMAEALPDSGVVIACELDPFVANFAQECFAASSHGSKIQVHVGPALATMQKLADEKETFDFVFIDAEKSGYIGYVRCLLNSSLLSENALVCVDNTLMQGQPYTSTTTNNGLAIKEFNKYLSDEPRVQQVLLPLRDGVTMIQKVG